MTPAATKIVCATASEDLSGILPLLVDRGFDVHRCSDGAHALETALTIGPELILVDTDVPLLPAEKLAHILWSNPRTQTIPLFFVGNQGERIEGFRRHRDYFVSRPFNSEQLLTSVIRHFRRKERTELVGQQEKDIEGSLRQIPLIDLLQVLAVNRRDGVLYLSRSGERGAIFLADGRVVNARCGHAQGEKGFYRLLQWQEGGFSFAPGRTEGEVRISTPLDQLILGGVYQNEEMENQAHLFPGPDAVLALKVPRNHFPRGLRPATLEILGILEHYQRVGDIVDHCPWPDFDILQILKILLEKGLLEEQADCTVPQCRESVLLDSEAILAVKDRLGASDVLLDEMSAKLLLLTSSPEQAAQWARIFQGMEEFEPPPEGVSAAGSLGLGELGRLELAESFHLRLFALPVSQGMSPLWEPFCRKVFGVVAPSGAPTLKDAASFFKYNARLPVATISWGQPEANAFLLRYGDREGMRDLLAYFASHFRRKPQLRKPPVAGPPTSREES